MIMLGVIIFMVIVSEELAFPVRGRQTRINRRAGGEMVKLRSGGTRMKVALQILEVGGELGHHWCLRKKQSM